MLLDESHHHPDAAAPRAQAEGFVGLLTPVAKAFFTDNGLRGADEALQVWGGYGFVHDYGIEQTVRDSRIAMIYEGTNEIQAIDLLQRKVLDDGGARLGALLDRLVADADVRRAGTGRVCRRAARPGGGRLRGHGRAGRRRAPRPRMAAARRRRLPARHRPDAAGLGLAARGGRGLAACRATAWHDDTLRAARFGVQWLLPEAGWRWQRVRAQQAELPAL